MRLLSFVSRARLWLGLFLVLCPALANAHGTPIPKAEGDPQTICHAQCSMENAHIEGTLTWNPETEQCEGDAHCECDAGFSQVYGLVDGETELIAWFTKDGTRYDHVIAGSYHDGSGSGNRSRLGESTSDQVDLQLRRHSVRQQCGSGQVLLSRRAPKGRGLLRYMIVVSSKVEQPTASITG